MVQPSYDLGERLLNYAIRIIKVVEALPQNIIGKRIGDQLLRSGTSAGENYEEAQAGESHADFTHKLQVSLKELRESRYWLLVIAKAELLSSARLTKLIDEATELRAMLSKAVATAKKNQKTKDKSLP